MLQETESSDSNRGSEDSQKNETTRKSMIKWTLHEDKLISNLVEIHGTRQWSVIGAYLPGRSGKQCRERCGVFEFFFLF